MHRTMVGGVWTSRCSNGGEFSPKSAMSLFITRKYKPLAKVRVQPSPELKLGYLRASP